MNAEYRAVLQRTRHTTILIFMILRETKIKWIGRKIDKFNSTFFF